MNAFVKSSVITLLAATGLGLGGCVYYPVRTGVVYDGGNGNAVVDYDDSRADYYAPAPAYYGYSDPYWYGPGWYGFGPSISLGFYGGGYWGGHHYRGPWRGGYYHGGWGGGRGVVVHHAAPPSHGGRH